MNFRTEQEGGREKSNRGAQDDRRACGRPLIDALCDRDWHIRLGAARALVTIEETRCRAAGSGSPQRLSGCPDGGGCTARQDREPGCNRFSLIDTLLHEDWHVGRVVVRALGMMGEEAVRTAPPRPPGRE